MYIVGEEVFARYPVMRTYGLAPQVVETDLIPYAEAELNARLGVAFSVPFTDGSSSFMLKDLAIELTYCKALFTKDPKQYEVRYKMLTDRIDDIVKGKVTLDVSSGGFVGADAGEVWSTTMGYAPVHSMLDAEDSRIDPQQQRDDRRKRMYGVADDEDL